MLETISKGFRSVKNRFQGKRELTEEYIDEALREIRISLLEADVDFKVVRCLLAPSKKRPLVRSSKLSPERVESGSRRGTILSRFAKMS